MSSSCCQRSASLSHKIRSILDQRMSGIAGIVHHQGLLPSGPMILCNASFEVVAAIDAGLAVGRQQQSPREQQQLQLNEGGCDINNQSKKADDTTHSKKSSAVLKTKKQSGIIENPNLWAEASALAQALGALRLAASRFATTLEVVETLVMHVKGDALIFSCYSVGSGSGSGGYYLALHSAPEAADMEIESFDLYELDAQLAPKLEDLELFLDGISIKQHQQQKDHV